MTSGVSVSSLLVFQFTHPGRGATESHFRARPLYWCFNSRTPGGVRRLIIATFW